MKVCGIDMGKSEDRVFFADRLWSVAHEVRGWLELDRQLPEDCVVVFEGRCAELERLLGERPLYSIDPGRSAQIRRVLMEAKDDSREARLLAHLWQVHPTQFKRIEAREPELQHLRRLSRLRRSLVQQQTQLLQQLQALQSRGARPEREWLQDLARGPYAGLVRVLAAIRQEIAQVEQELVRQGEKLPACRLLRSIKGMGTNLSAEIVAELDSFAPFRQRAHAQAYAGTAPVTLASGKRRFVRLRQRCNHRARNALYLFAFCSLRFHPWARHYYDAARARGKSHTAALMALANRWLPVLLAMVKTNTSYDPSRKRDFYN